MVKFIKHVKVYPFSELSEEAKEEAKRWYLNDETRCNDLTLYYESDIGCIFPNSDLNVQWSLNSCQGDGVNIYGSVNCEFQSGKIYHCDLNASYNIGSRYFIREILKSVPVTVQQDIGAKVPRCLKRSTCTLSDLISLAAVLAA